ncbi:MAG: hypothetical protein ACYC3S_02130 [Chloroflexota bacterium]
MGRRARAVVIGLAVALVIIVFVPLSEVRGQVGQAQPLALASLLIPPNDRFGLNRAAYGAEENAGYRHEFAAEAGSAWNRWPLYWYMVESERAYSYAAYDRAVAGDLLRGTNLDIVLLGTPPTYTSAATPAVPPPDTKPGNGQTSGPGPINTQATTPKNLDQPVFADGTDDYAPGKKINPNNYWARFVNLTAERYKPNGELFRHGDVPAGVGVRNWEIWNEPDVRFYWSARGPGTEVLDYLRLLKVAYLSIKAADKDAKIVIGGLGYWGREGWIEELFKAINGDPASDKNGKYFDVMAWHVYSRAVDLYNRASWSRYLLRDHGMANKEVWINETNIPVWGDPTPGQRDPGTHRAAPDEQAAFLLQAYAYAFAGGADKVFTFMLYDDCWQYGEHYGLVRNPPGQYAIADCPSDGQPRPGYYAYKLAASFLRDIGNGKVTSYGPGGAVDAVSFDTSRAARVTVIANKFGSPVTVDLPVRGRSLLIDQSGDVRSVSPGPGNTFRLEVPGATANDAAANEPPFYIVGGRTFLLVEPAPAKPIVSFTNGGFELRPELVGWLAEGASPVLVNAAVHGSSAAVLSIDPPNKGLSGTVQTITLPVRSNPVLSLSYALATAQPVRQEDGGPELSTFEVTVSVPGEDERIILLERGPVSWRERTFPLADYGGKVITLALRVRGEVYPLAAYVDEVNLWPYRVLLPEISVTK